MWLSGFLQVSAAITPEWELVVGSDVSEFTSNETNAFGELNGVMASETKFNVVIEEKIFFLNVERWKSRG